MFNKLFVSCITIVLLSLCSPKLFADTPMIGAQIIIEPGQNAEQIDGWFKTLKDNGMYLCRIRLFEAYIHQSDGSWDFTLFDKAFKAAEKYNIKVFATLFPTAPNNPIAGFRFPSTTEHQAQISEYINQMVSHYKNFKSLYGWVLLNEPGVMGYLPETDYNKQKFNEWKKNQPVESTYKSKGYPLLKDFDKQKFLVDYNTWYLNWIADEIAKYDTGHDIHVNNHQIFENIAEYDFPAWRKFLTSLGASAHPSWHFVYFNRPQYAMALSANCNIIRSGAGHLPFYITELQGGNNTYSGMNPFCPTDKEITQWLWVGVASGMKGVIFWSLNSRSVAKEAGEWALIDFQGQSTDRLNSAHQVAISIEKNKEIFSDVKPLNSNIHILYNRPSLWIESAIQFNGSNSNYEGRQPGGVIKSAMTYYEILCENGIVPNVNEFNEFDWTKPNYKGVSIILANMISLPSYDWDNIRNFVKRGGQLFVEGITGYYDENMLSLFSTGFPLHDVFGGSLSEVNCIPSDFNTIIDSYNMPVHLWESYIHKESGEEIGKKDNHITGIKNAYGNGRVIWSPSLLGLGARRTGNYQPLSDFLLHELKPTIPICFEKREKGLFMQTSKGTKSFFSIIINKNKETKILHIKSPYKPTVIFSDGKMGLNANELTINPEETVVIEWK